MTRCIGLVLAICLIAIPIEADEVKPLVSRQLELPSGPIIALDGRLRHMMVTYSFDPGASKLANSDCKDLIKEVRRLKGKIKSHSKKKIRTGHQCNLRFSIGEDVCGSFAAFVRKGEQEHSVITSIWNPKTNNLGCR